MKKMLCIVGPTATRKTQLALDLSQEFPACLISADSRQVYRGLDIVTGKDHSPDFRLAGIDIVNPEEECSVAVWHRSVSPSLGSGLLAIVVGGTGLYVRALTDGIETMDIQPDSKLRARFAGLTLEELQAELRELDPDKFTTLNNSDLHNPRRLIRALEISNAGGKKGLIKSTNPQTNALIIGLNPPEPVAYRALIESRVHKRLEQGAIRETESLINHFGSGLPSMSAIGYSSIIDFIAGNLTGDQLTAKWVDDEMSYAKRQMTWFQKVPGIIWFDSAGQSIYPAVAKCVREWYD